MARPTLVSVCLKTIWHRCVASLQLTRLCQRDLTGCIKTSIFKRFKNLGHVQSGQLKNGHNYLGAMYHVIQMYILISL